MLLAQLDEAEKLVEQRNEEIRSLNQQIDQANLEIVQYVTKVATLEEKTKSADSSPTTEDSLQQLQGQLKLYIVLFKQMVWPHAFCIYSWALNVTKRSFFVFEFPLWGVKIWLQADHKSFIEIQSWSIFWYAGAMNFPFSMGEFIVQSHGCGDNQLSPVFVNSRSDPLSNNHKSDHPNLKKMNFFIIIVAGYKAQSTLTGSLNISSTSWPWMVVYAISNQPLKNTEGNSVMCLVFYLFVI